MTIAIMSLLRAVGKLALHEGEDWRLDHPELMDAYAAASEELKCGLGVKNKNDTDTHKTKT